MAERTEFPAPIATHALPGFPDTLEHVAQARAVIETTRLPAIRSGYAWLQAYNRLTEALATRSNAQIEAASFALRSAIVDEQRDRRSDAGGYSTAMAA